MKKYNNERDLKETKGFRVHLNLPQTVSTSVVLRMPRSKNIIYCVKKPVPAASSLEKDTVLLISCFVIQHTGLKKTPSRAVKALRRMPQIIALKPNTECQKFTDWFGEIYIHIYQKGDLKSFRTFPAVKSCLWPWKNTTWFV